MFLFIYKEYIRYFLDIYLDICNHKDCATYVSRMLYLKPQQSTTYDSLYSNKKMNSTTIHCDANTASIQKYAIIVDYNNNANTTFITTLSTYYTNT